MKHLLILLISALAALDAGLAQENAAPAAPAQKEMLEWLATNDAAWQAAYKREVTDVQDAEFTKLNRQYQAALESGITRASSGNDLKGALGLRDEQKRFTETGIFPKQDEPDEAAILKQMRAGFRGAFAQVERDAAVRAKVLHARYDQALAQAQAQLTQKQRLDDAVLVQKKREEIAAAWLKTPVGSAPAPAESHPEDPLTKLTRAPWTWETVTGKNAITFAKNGTCVHTRGSGTFQLEGNTVTVKLPTRTHVLTFDLQKGEYTGYDPLLKQTITGHQMAPDSPDAAAVLALAKTTAPPAATPAPKGTNPAAPEAKSAFDGQLQKLTRATWTWETPTGKGTIKFAKDGTCVHTKFNGTFEIQKDDTVVVHMPARDEVLLFDFNKGEYSGYDAVLKQKITGKRTYQK